MSVFCSNQSKIRRQIFQIWEKETAAGGCRVLGRLLLAEAEGGVGHLRECECGARHTQKDDAGDGCEKVQGFHAFP